MNDIGDPKKLRQRKQKPRKQRKLQKPTKKTYKRKRFTSKEISWVSSLFYSVLALLSQFEASPKNWRIFPAVIGSKTMTIDYESLAKAQLKDKELLNFLESNLSLKIDSRQ